jgi:hypothetical protein
MRASNMGMMGKAKKKGGKSEIQKKRIMNYITITEKEPTDNNSLAIFRFFDVIVVAVEVWET